MKSRCIVFIFSLSLLATDVAAQETISSTLNIHYGLDSLQQLDVFWNPSVRNSPVLIFIHGGGYLSGDKSNYHEMATSLAKNGITCVLVNYRLSPRVKYPSHVQDVATAVAWVFKNIRNNGGSHKKIVLFGHSAGGHMATLLAVNSHFLAEHNIKASRIQGVIVVSGVFEIKTQEGGATPKYLGMVFGDDPRVWEEASCQFYSDAKKRLPSFLISWSAEENPLIVSESTNFIQSFANQPAKLNTHVFPGGDHNAFQNELTNTNSKFFELISDMID